jgi:hypothetical protein
MVSGYAGGGRIKKAPEAGRELRKARAKVAVDVDARRHLIEACAFFHADRFRPVAPGCYRQQDLADAAAEIDAVLKRSGRKGRSGKR